MHSFGSMKSLRSVHFVVVDAVDWANGYAGQVKGIDARLRDHISHVSLLQLGRLRLPRHRGGTRSRDSRTQV